jgi:hypothetical protein
MANVLAKEIYGWAEKLRRVSVISNLSHAMPGSIQDEVRQMEIDRAKVAYRSDVLAERSWDKAKDLAKTAAVQCGVAIAAARSSSEVERLAGSVRAAEEAMRKVEEVVTGLEERCSASRFVGLAVRKMADIRARAEAALLAQRKAAE